MDAYPRAAVERAMKVQEVMLRAIARKLTWYRAAEILGITDRHLRRWRERYEQGGFDGLLDRRRCRPSEKRVPLATVEQVLALYRDRYFDFNVRHFHEKLGEEHGIGLSYTWVKAALQGAGLVARGRKRGVHRKRRPRAYSPQARGRSERNFGTWQGRLPQELRLRGIRSLEAANRFLREHYMAEFKRRFQVPAAPPGSAFVRRRSKDLDLIVALQFERTVNRDNTVSVQHLHLQIEPVRWRATLAGGTVIVHQHLDGTFTITHGPQRLGHYRAEGVSLEREKIG